MKLPIWLAHAYFSEKGWVGEKTINQTMLQASDLSSNPLGSIIANEHLDREISALGERLGWWTW